jgi:hypothetical protein
VFLYDWGMLSLKIREQKIKTLRLTLATPCMRTCITLFCTDCRDEFKIESRIMSEIGNRLEIVFF